MEITDDDIRLFQNTVRENSGYDFHDYTVLSLKRRLTRIVENYDFKISNLIAAISSDKNIMEDVVKKITVTTTELFRDPLIWRKAISEIIPKFEEYNSINIWHAGCSAGQEVYSMMILLDHFKLLEKSNIYASDMNSDVIDIAIEGIYNLHFHEDYFKNYNKVFAQNELGKSEYTNNSKKYFKIDKSSDKIEMTKFLTLKPLYKKNDLTKLENPFPVKFDLIFCRNVIIYFNDTLQSKILKMFHRNMKENSFLILGKHEFIIGDNSMLFKKNDVFYRKKNNYSIR